MRFAFIEQHAFLAGERYVPHARCVAQRLLRLAPSVPQRANDSEVGLLDAMRGLQMRHQGRYGSPLIHAALRTEGHRCSRGRVERLMRRHRIRALAGRRFRPCTTDSRHYLPIAPNLLAQRFSAPATNSPYDTKERLGGGIDNKGIALTL